MHKHPYIFVIVFATIFAVVAWYFTPKEYSVTTKLSDEYKETDLAIGLNSLTARLKKSIGSDNNNMNDIEIYCKTLKTLDFARALSLVHVPEKHMTYAEWVMSKRYFWQTNDTIQAILDNIEYNYSTKQQTLTIRFTDRDALVAAEMLDSAIVHLQTIVTRTRHLESKSAFDNYKKQLEQNARKYNDAQAEYAAYCDSHRNVTRQEELQRQNFLKNEMKLALDEYNESSKQYSRQLALMQRDYCSFAIIKSVTVPKEDTSHPFVYICVCVLLSVIGVKGYRLLKCRISEHSKIDFGGVFSPWSITLLIWGGMAFLFMIWGDELYPLSKQFYISISLWILGLTITSFATYNLLNSQSQVENTLSIDINKIVFWSIFALSLIMSPWLLYKVYQTVSMFDSKDLMRNVRILAVDGGGQGFLNFSQLLSQVTFIVSIWAYPKVRLWVIALSALCCVCCSIALMEKGTIFLVIISGLYVMYCRRVIRVRTIGVVMLMLVGIFFFFNILREGTESDYSKNETFLGFIGMYVMSPPVAFGTIARDISDQFGINSLGIVYDYLQRFGIIDHIEVHDKMQEFVCVPVITNVYTIMQPFYRDFGYMGVAFFSVIYGLISGFLYRKSQNGVGAFKCLYTYMVNILVLQFFQDNLFLSLSFCIQFAIVVALCTFTSYRIRV